MGERAGIVRGKRNRGEVTRAMGGRARIVVEGQVRRRSQERWEEGQEE